jgi:hypothetical protein
MMFLRLAEDRPGRWRQDAREGEESTIASRRIEDAAASWLPSRIPDKQGDSHRNPTTMRRGTRNAWLRMSTSLSCPGDGLPRPSSSPPRSMWGQAGHKRG